MWLQHRERDISLLCHCPGHSICRIRWCSVSLQRDRAHTGLSAMLILGTSLWITHRPSSWVRARFAWEVDTLAQDSGYTNKCSSVRADKGFPSRWKLTISTRFVHSKLCKAIVLGCRYRTSSLIFKGVKYLQNPLVLTAKNAGYYCYLSANIWISGSNWMHHGLIKLLPGALPK